MKTIFVYFCLVSLLACQKTVPNTWLQLETPYYRLAYPPELKPEKDNLIGQEFLLVWREQNQERLAFDLWFNKDDKYNDKNAYKFREQSENRDKLRYQVKWFKTYRQPLDQRGPTKRTKMLYINEAKDLYVFKYIIFDTGWGYNFSFRTNQKHLLSTEALADSIIERIVFK